MLRNERSTCCQLCSGTSPSNPDRSGELAACLSAVQLGSVATPRGPSRPTGNEIVNARASAGQGEVRFSQQALDLPTDSLPLHPGREEFRGLASIELHGQPEPRRRHRAALRGERFTTRSSEGSAQSIPLARAVILHQNSFRAIIQFAKTGVLAHFHELLRTARQMIPATCFVSFPRRRESRILALIRLDSRLRGNDHWVHWLRRDR